MRAVYPLRAAFSLFSRAGKIVVFSGSECAIGVVSFFAVRENESGRKARGARDQVVGRMIDSIGLGSWACLGVTVAIIVGLGLWAAYDVFNPTPNEITLVRDEEEEEDSH